MKAIVILILLPFSCAWQGFALSKLWLWFAVPVFGVEPIRIPFAIGLAVLLATARARVRKSTEPKGDVSDDYFKAALAHMIFGPAAGLLIGWIATLFI